MLQPHSRKIIVSIPVLFLATALCAVSYAQNAPTAKTVALPTNADCLECHASTVNDTSFKKSVHKDASCTDCHSDVTSAPHDNMPGPVDCSSCHPDMVETFSKSIHFSAVTKTNTAVMCSSCHGTHEIISNGVTPEQCTKCHQPKYATYLDTFHGKSTALGFGPSAKCSDCHTKHLVLPAENSNSSVNKGHLKETCGQCHKDISNNFIGFAPHPDPKDKNKSPLVYWTTLFMELLLLACFAFWGTHTLLWLQRAIVAIVRKEFTTHEEGTQYVRRFNKISRTLHIIIVISFLGLAITGLPIKYFYAPWAKFLTDLVGGVATTRLIHRICGAVTLSYFIFHLLHLARRLIIKKDFGILYGPRSFIPRMKDLIDLKNNIKWFLYMGECPKYDRWTYFEKFDYFAVFWGVCIIGSSGLLLWFPALFTQILPGEFLNVAAIVHSEEALLAIVFIFTIHFFHTHLRPESFPMDDCIFTGVIPLDRLKRERPEEYDRLVREGRLEELLVPPPRKITMIRSWIFGFTALAIGVAIDIAIFITLLNHHH